VTARTSFGSVRIFWADDVTVEVRPRIEHGSVEENSPDITNGIDADGAASRWGPGSTPDVVIDAWVAMGAVTLHPHWNAPPPGGEDALLGPATTAAPSAVVGNGRDTLYTARDDLRVSADGWVLIGPADSSAAVVLVSPDDQAVSAGAGANFFANEDGSWTIETMYGDYRLLPRSLLLVPDGSVIDLAAVRADAAAALSEVTPIPPIGPITTDNTTASTVPSVTTMPPALPSPSTTTTPTSEPEG
jgi:hypothetical protein